mmetsp:Transcript_173880/g.557322  ORF Transcript_173880/g.557322 Transcript_173880/m.557322 type:complete len:260 (+) Transcript_173880:272-1051(+)
MAHTLFGVWPARSSERPVGNNRGEVSGRHRIFRRRPPFLVHTHVHVESGACRIWIRVLFKVVGDAAPRAFVARGDVRGSLGVPRRRRAAIIMEIRRPHGRRGCWRLPRFVCAFGKWRTRGARRKHVEARRKTAQLRRRIEGGDVLVPRQPSEGPGGVLCRRLKWRVLPRSHGWRLRCWLLPRSLAQCLFGLPPRLLLRLLHDGGRKLLAPPGIARLLHDGSWRLAVPRGLVQGLALLHRALALLRRGLWPRVRSHVLLD